MTAQPLTTRCTTCRAELKAAYDEAGKAYNNAG